MSDARFQYHDLRHAVEMYDDRIPPDYVPIMASGWDEVCLGTAANNYGQIYLWDEEEERPENCMHFIAANFGEFLVKIRPFLELEELGYREKLPIFQAVERGQLTTVLDYLFDGGKVDCRNERGWTLLTCAARNRWPKLMRLLLENQADPNALDGKRLSPLYHAVLGQSNDGVKLLVAAGADPAYCTPRGRSLPEVAKKHSFSRVKYTLEGYLGTS